MPTTSNHPLAYLITFHAYGSWLHGAAKGSVDEFHNAPGEEFVPADRARRTAMQSRMKSPAIRFAADQRHCIEEAIHGVCSHRGWELLAINVRTNHVHVVVVAAAKPEKAMNDFKSWATRRLREAGLVDRDARVWSRHGSTRYLLSEQSVENARRYVIEGQGVDLNKD